MRVGTSERESRVGTSEEKSNDRYPIGASVVVLIPDADSAAARWSPALLKLLSEAGFRVVLFENRDAGAGVDSAPGYLLPDMADDVASVIAEFGGEPVHIFGVGMGGTIALHVALRHPLLVRSLVLIGASPGRSDERLPDPNPEFVDAMVARAWAGAPTSREDQVVWLVELAQLLAGNRYPFDEVGEVVRAAAQVDLRSVADESGHGHAVVETRSVLDDLERIAQPTLVIHGTVDPVYPLAHGEVIANGVENGRLLSVEGLGHEVPAEFVEEFGEVVLSALSLGVDGAT